MKRLDFVVVLVHLLHAINSSSRDKRQLVYPPKSVMQLAFAVVTPAQVQSRQITTNMGIMFNIDLPTNTSVWYPWRTDYRRKRAADSDQAFYQLLSSALSMSGLNGTACMQKTVCQTKEIPFQRNDDIFTRIFSLMFGYGQTHTEPLWEPGHHNTSCDQAFPSCQLSPVDLFFQLITSSWTSSQ